MLPAVGGARDRDAPRRQGLKLSDDVPRAAAAHVRWEPAGAYSHGYSKGWSRGYSKGYSQRYSQGYSQGSSQGFSMGSHRGTHRGTHSGTQWVLYGTLEGGSPTAGADDVPGALEEYSRGTRGVLEEYSRVYSSGTQRVL
jgi:hypothetical protein